jgi:hypothetical protein
MFNFIVFSDTTGRNSSTQALLCDENRQPIEGASYSVTFDASDRRTRIMCHGFVGEEHKRLSVTRHAHNNGHIGAWVNDAVVYQD